MFAMASRSTLTAVPGDAPSQTIIPKSARAISRSLAAYSPVAQIIAGFLGRMEDPDMFVAVAREQALRLGIGSRGVANQHAVHGNNDWADPSDGRFRQLKYLA
ncbi:hypothetical protein [Mesorhizobium sp. M0208]|uniref:hypothetical protein n=1 Tax=unclassified Mesorhizobium TaxID=325217 RepID=UPI003337201D